MLLNSTPVSVFNTTPRALKFSSCVISLLQLWLLLPHRWITATNDTVVVSWLPPRLQAMPHAPSSTANDSALYNTYSHIYNSQHCSPPWNQHQLHQIQSFQLLPHRQHLHHIQDGGEAMVWGRAVERWGGGDRAPILPCFNCVFTPPLPLLTSSPSPLLSSLQAIRTPNGCHRQHWSLHLCSLQIHHLYGRHRHRPSKKWSRHHRPKLRLNSKCQLRLRRSMFFLPIGDKFCARDAHNISYRYYIECHFEENGYSAYYYKM